MFFLHHKEVIRWNTLIYCTRTTQPNGWQKGRASSKEKYELMHDFLELNLDPDSCLEAENLLNGLVLTIEQESFYAGIKYLPLLLKELMEE